MWVEVISLAEVGGGWGMQGDAHFGREDGKFFRLLGVKITNAGREVMSWGQPMIQEIGEGLVVLVQATDERQHRPVYLVAARAEPGNYHAPGHVLLAPTIQASRSNLEGAHGGSRPPRAELLRGREYNGRRLHEDGGRFIGKTNCYVILELPQEEVGPLNADERWFSRAELREAYLDGELNAHLMIAFLGAVL